MEIQSKTPGDIKFAAISYAKRMKMHFNASDPSVVHKQLIDLVVDLYINHHGFNGPVPITVDEYNDFEEDVTLISNELASVVAFDSLTGQLLSTCLLPL
jgi:hypothetical protein